MTIYRSEDDEEATVGCNDSVNPQDDVRKGPYEPKNLFLLCSKETLEKRIRAVEIEKKQIEPQQLSTSSTAQRLQLMKTKDLIDSIELRFRKRAPQLPSRRQSDLTYYNWLLLDLARRATIVQQRLRKEFPHTWRVEFRRQVIDPAAAYLVSGSIKHTNVYTVVSESNEYFDLFASFVSTKRRQILELAQIFGDEICALIEFI
ncbi:hypothetical protein BJV82DRAFT_707817, partial [Fennellomyces sp. T-0311]